MHSASDVARYILTYCRKLGRKLDNLHLQKILYFVWADYYTKTKQRLFLDRIEAWHYGPVVPSVYRQYSHYVASYINMFDEIELRDAHIDFINGSIKKYSAIHVSILIKMSHEDGTPWSKCHSNGYSNPIPFEMIEAYCDAHA